MDWNKEPHKYSARVNITLSVEMTMYGMSFFEEPPELDREVLGEAVARAIHATHWSDVDLGPANDPWYATLVEVEEAVTEDEEHGWTRTTPDPTPEEYEEFAEAEVRQFINQDHHRRGGTV